MHRGIGSCSGCKASGAAGEEPQEGAAPPERTGSSQAAGSAQSSSHCCRSLVQSPPGREAAEPSARSASPGATTAVTQRWHRCASGGNRAGDTTTALCARRCRRCHTLILPSQNTEADADSLENGGNGGGESKKRSSAVRKFCLNADSLGFYPAIHNTAPQPQNICLPLKHHKLSSHWAVFLTRSTGQARPLRARIQPRFCFPSAPLRSQISSTRWLGQR